MRIVVRAVDFALQAFNGLVVVFRLLVALGSEIQYVFLLALDKVGFLINSLLTNINNVIKGINLITGKNIPTFNMISEESQDLAVQTARESADKAWAAFNAQMNKKVFSFAEVMASGGGGTFERPEGGDEPERTGKPDEKAIAKAEQEKKEREARLQAIRESLMSEAELERVAWEEQQKFLKEAALVKGETQAERDALMEEAEREHLERMRVINKGSVDDIYNLKHKGWIAQILDQNSALGKMAQDLRGNLTTIFGDNKAFNLAMGLIDAYKAIMSSYKFGAEVGGPPLGAAMAAIAGAAQFKILSDMASVQPGSSKGGGGGGGGGGGKVASAPAQNALPAAAESGGGQATINIVGGDEAIFSGKQVRALVEQINDQVAKGMTLRFA
jgi:hypothetical protein